MPSLVREMRIPNSACHESGHEAVTALDSGAVAERGQVQELLVRELDRPHPRDLEGNGETEMGAQLAG